MEWCNQCNNLTLRWSIRRERYECQNCGSLYRVDLELVENRFSPLDLLMWVGGGGYPTIEDFVKEAEDLGCCKRVTGYPSLARIGQSKVFLVHSNGKESGGDIFGYYKIRAVQMVVQGEGDLDEIMRRRGVQPVTMEQAMQEPERGCGFRVILGAIYIVSNKDMEKLSDLAGKSDLRGKIVLFDTTIPIFREKFRGFKYVRGSRILKGKPEEQWFVDEQERREMRKKKGRRKVTIESAS